jgi:deoxyribose-phosphate aldolase
VYWGSPDIGEHFNPDGIITLTPEMDYSILTEELYQSKIEAVKDNMERVSKLANSDDMLYKVIMENL